MSLILEALIYRCILTNPHIYVFHPKIQPFLINNIRLRESINPVFAVQTSQDKLNSSEEYTGVYSGKITYGKKQLTDLTVYKDSWNLIDSILVDVKSVSSYFILASTQLNSDEILEYTINDNSISLDISYGSNMANFNHYILYPGIHNISMWVKHYKKTYIKPTLKKGFSQCYQLAIWKNNRQKDVYPYKINYNNSLINSAVIDIPNNITPPVKKISNIVYRLIDGIL